MKKTHVFAAASCLLIAATALSGCGSSAKSTDLQAKYQTQKNDIPTMVKKFSAPNLGVLLNGLKIGDLEPKVLDAETLGTTRLADQQGVQLFSAATFTPAECRDKLIDTYKDNVDIPAAFSQDISKDKKNIIRVQLRAHASVEEAAEISESQRELAKTCPHYTVAVSGAGIAGNPESTPEGVDKAMASAGEEVTDFKVMSKEYALDGASDGLMSTYIAKNPHQAPGQDSGTVATGPSSGYTMVGIFQRIGNLELRVYFDGTNPEKVAEAAKPDLQKLVTHLGQALVAKAD